MNLEFEKVQVIFTDQIRHPLPRPGNKLLGYYCSYQNVIDEEPEGEVTIVNANSSALKENQMQYFN